MCNVSSFFIKKKLLTKEKLFRQLKYRNFLEAPQYSNQPSAFYPVGPHQDISIYYPGLSRDAGRPVYDQQRPQGFQIDHKIPEHYTTLRTASSQHGHVIHPGPGLAINPAQAAPKGIYTFYVFFLCFIKNLSKSA